MTINRKLFTKENIELLSQNKYVKKFPKNQLHIQMNLKYYLSLSEAMENFLLIFFKR